MQEPDAFAQALDGYLDSLSPEEIRTLVLRSLKRLDGAHRAQLALFLGFDIAEHPIDEVGRGGDDRPLVAAVASCKLLRERFRGFLRENPRAIAALGKGPSERILGPSDRKWLAFRSKLPPRAASLAALVVAVAFVPLIAQYWHQRGMLSGLSDAIMVPPRAAVALYTRVAHVRPAAAAVVPSHVRPARTLATLHQTVRQTPVRSHAAVPVHTVHVQPQRRQLHAARAVPRRAHRRIARAWKFDPRNNPYFNHARWSTLRNPAPARVAVRRLDGFQARSTLMVMSYLHALIAGKTTAALQHLGLPADAPVSDLTEAPIIAPGAHTRLVNVTSTSDGATRVQVDITSRAGEYFETFYVARDGPAARITTRYFVQLNRTAEERAAHLLAKDVH